MIDFLKSSLSKKELNVSKKYTNNLPESCSQMVRRSELPKYVINAKFR